MPRPSPSPDDKAVSAASLGLAALTIAEAGGLVFPVNSTDSGGRQLKSPMTVHGHLDATSDTEQIRKWWTEQPDAAIGTPTGAPYFTVLDIDTRDDNDGGAALNALQLAGLLRGCGRVIRTPSGGLHLYFEGNEEPSRTVLHHRVDLKSVGGYVLAPPSRLQVGDTWRSYEVLEQDERFAPLDWASCSEVLENLKPTVSRSVAGLVRVVTSAPTGGRNKALYWAACRATEACLDTSALVAAAVDNGLSANEAHRTVASAQGSVTTVPA